MGEAVAFQLVHDVTPWLAGLERACEYELFDLTVPIIVERVAAGDLLALRIDRYGLAVLQLIPAKAGKTLTVVAITGVEPKRWLQALVDFLDRLAKDQDCQQVLVWGRPGWQRLLKQHGYRQRLTGLTRAIA